MGFLSDFLDWFVDSTIRSMDNACKKNDKFYRENREWLENDPEAMAEFSERKEKYENARSQAYEAKANMEANRNNHNNDY